ncbi:MAG: GIY-YIG nuclease family protein [Ignavibacteria bacterium]|nr:GIY-YIG nuclease family protein [Ignavibacteria bacterium]
MDTALKKYYVYCLYSISHDRLYIGQTDNIERRLKQHESGKAPSTKPYLPVRVVHIEELDSREKAVQRERELKSSNGRRFLRDLL